MNDLVLNFNKKFSCALLVDAAFRSGASVKVAPPGLLPLDNHYIIAGPILTVEANNDLVSILEAVHIADSDTVIVISNRTLEVALIGDLIVAEANRKHLAGFIVDGLVRDAAELKDIGLPVFCRGLLPVGPLKLPSEMKGMGEIGVDISIGEATIKTGDWAFGDADGIIFLETDDLLSVYDWAEKSWKREEALSAEIAAGKSLGDLLGIEDFLAEREKNPQADFNQHLAKLGRAI